MVIEEGASLIAHRLKTRAPAVLEKACLRPSRPETWLARGKKHYDSSIQGFRFRV